MSSVRTSFILVVPPDRRHGASISGEHPDWDDYQRAMMDQRRVLIRVSLDNVGPTRAG